MSAIENAAPGSRRAESDPEPMPNQRSNPRKAPSVDQPGDLFIVSAPSGAGKTTLIRKVTNGSVAGLDRVHFAVSHTTRPPRLGEVEGRDYHFVSPELFDGMVAGDQFLEWATVHGNRYGTSRAEVEPRLRAGWDVLLDIDVQGAARLLSGQGLGLPPETRLHSIFILPPTFAALRERLLQRGSSDPSEVERRLAEAHREIAQVDRYQYVIVNRDASAATGVLASIILAKRHRRLRMAATLRSLLGEDSSPGEP